MHKPSEVPVRKNCTNSWSGWVDKSEAQFIAIDGVVIVMASGGTLKWAGEPAR